MKPPLALLLPACALLAAASFSCAVSPPPVQNKPAWWGSPSAVYPNHLYISYDGGGQDRASAEAGAKAGIVSFFRQNLKIEASIFEREWQYNEYASSSLDWIQSIEISAALDALIGVEIKETWYDGSGGTGWWAVAVMDKSRGRAAYSAELDKTIAAAYRGLDFSEGFEFDRPIQCATVLALLDTAETYTAILRLLDGPDRRGEVERLAAAVHHAARQARAVTVDVRVAGDRGGAIKGAFSNVLAGLGYHVGGPSRYVLEATVSTEPAPRGRYFNTRYTIEAVITGAHSGVEQFVYHVQGRESHIASQGEADNRAILSASALIREEFPKALREYVGEITPKMMYKK